VWGDGIDNLLAVKIGDVVYTALTDIQGTIWGFTDGNGDVVARWTYDAWGNILSLDATVPVLASIRYRFQGREWSKVTGLTNFRMRWYDSVTGRWLSKDPIGLNGGVNLYLFIGSYMTNSRDPYGLMGLKLFVRPSPILQLFESSPKVFPRPVQDALPKGWRPTDPIPREFQPPPNPKGNYHCPRTGESLHPDMGHPNPIGPHYDYVDVNHNHFRIDIDGNITPKIIPAGVPPPSKSPTPPSNGRLWL
jgi:RHS repeat-associated protein